MSALWLLLIHQIPPKPAYLRVKIGRRLQRLGAVALKNTVYVLPRSEAATEDFQWVRREVVAGGGDATVLEGQLLDGLTDAEVEGLFRAAREADYRDLVDEARALGRELAAADDPPAQAEADVTRLERRLEEIIAIDFFGASGREVVSGLVSELRQRLTVAPEQGAFAPLDAGSYRGRIWVTRTGVHVDRIASAWLVRRFIDPDARFKFVSAKGYVPASGELRFDMFDAEFTHEGDRCTFETLCARFALRAPGLAAIAEVVHDIDLKDNKFGRPETAGVAAQVVGIARTHRDDDEARLADGFTLFDALLSYFAHSKEGRS